MMVFVGGTVYAGKPLPSDEAFRVNASVSSAHDINVQWTLAPDYYLYANKLKFTLTPDTAFTPVYPASTIKHDPILGDVAIFSGEFAVSLNLPQANGAYKLTIHYQGCSKEGFCYPPSAKTFAVDFNAPLGNNVVNNRIVTSEKITSLVSDQYGVQALFLTEHHGLMLLIFLGMGILLAFTPCVLPMLPILTGIIVGQKAAANTKKAFFLSLIYVCGMSITYALVGVMVALAGNSLQLLLQQPWAIIMSSIILMALAFSLFEFFDMPVSRRWQNTVSSWSSKHEGGTFLGVFLMGVLSTLVVSPCVTAPLVGVLIYIGRTGDVVLGGSALFVMGIGMGIPLILLGMSAGRWLPKSGKWMQAVTKSFGVMLFGMAIWLLSRIIPASIMLAVWGLFLLGVALFFSLYLTRIIGRHKINFTMGFLSALAGILMIASTLGLPIFTNKWFTTEPVPMSDFAVVHSITALQQKMAEAKTNGMPVLVDFYADWCTSCVVMDKEVFANATVQKSIAPFMLVRVDLSQNTAEDQQLLQQYNVIAPPTVLFFNTAGHEVESRRIVGELGAKEFLKRMDVFMADNCSKQAQC